MVEALSMGGFLTGQGALRLRHAHRDGGRIQGARLSFPAAQDPQEEIGWKLGI